MRIRIVWRWNICKEVRFVDGEEDIDALVWCVAVCVCGVRKSKKKKRRRDGRQVPASFAATSPLLFVLDKLYYMFVFATSIHHSSYLNLPLPTRHHLVV